MPITVGFPQAGSVLILPAGEDEREAVERFPAHLHLFGDGVKLTPALIVEPQWEQMVVGIVKRAAELLKEWNRQAINWNMVFYAWQLNEGRMSLQEVADLEGIDHAVRVKQLLTRAGQWHSGGFNNNSAGRLMAIRNALEFLGGYAHTDAIRFGVKLLTPNITFRGDFTSLLGDMQERKELWRIAQGRYVLVNRLPMDFRRLLRF